MSSLPGVKVGPLDPDTTQQFGTVSNSNNARTLIRLHTQMHPPALRRALSRPRDDERTLGLDLDEVREYLGGLTRDNGDPLVPEGAEVVAAVVRGDRQTGQILTFTYQAPSGRVGKWHAQYNPEVLPASFDAGADLVKVKVMKDRGVVAFDSEGTQTEIQRRQLTNLRRENAALRSQAESRGGADDAVTDGSEDEQPDTRVQSDRDAELAQLRRANAEMMTELQLLRAASGRGAGEMPTGGLEDEVKASPASQETDPPGDNVASADPPFEGYEAMKADQVATYLRADERTSEERQAVLDYERTHANRRSVVSAGEQSLGTGSGG